MIYRYSILLFTCSLFNNCGGNYPDEDKEETSKPTPRIKDYNVNKDYDVKLAIEDIKNFKSKAYNNKAINEIKSKIEKISNKISNEHQNDFTKALEHINNANKNNYKNELDKAIKRLESIIKVSDDYEQWIKILRKKESNCKYLPDYNSLYQASKYFKKQCDNNNHICYFNELKSQQNYQIKPDNNQIQLLNDFLKKHDITLIKGINVISQCNYCLKLYNNSNLEHENENMFDEDIGQFFQYYSKNVHTKCNNRSCMNYNKPCKIVPPFHPLIIVNNMHIKLTINDSKNPYKVNEKRTIEILDIKSIMKKENVDHFTIANAEFNQN